MSDNPHYDTADNTENSREVDFVEAPEDTDQDYTEIPDEGTPVQPPEKAPGTDGITTDNPQTDDNDELSDHTRPGGPEALPNPESEPLTEPHTPEAPAPFRRGGIEGGW